MSFYTVFNGIGLEYTVETYDRGDRWQPPEGGFCNGFEAQGIDDMDAFMEAIDDDRNTGPVSDFCFGIIQKLLTGEGYSKLPVRSRYKIEMRLVSSVIGKWAQAIHEHCTEHYWNDVGGPAGERDYHYDG